MKYRILLISAISCVAMTGCMSQPTNQAKTVTHVWTKVPVAEKEINMAKEKVASQLKDPESARFREIWALSNGEWTRVCGYVNAKNSYGGYEGYKMFTIGANGSVDFEDDELMEKYGQDWCTPRTEEVYRY